MDACTVQLPLDSVIDNHNLIIIIVPNQVIDPRSQSGTTNCDRTNLARQTPPTHYLTRWARQEASCNSIDRVLGSNIRWHSELCVHVHVCECCAKQGGHLKMEGSPSSYAALANTLVLCIIYVLIIMVGWESTSTCETQCIQVTPNIVTAKHDG